MYLSTEKRRIISTLRHGPLNPVEIAHDSDLPPFCVRGWLKELKRERLVEEHLTTREHHYRLTDRGHRAAAASDQIELEI